MAFRVHSKFPEGVVTVSLLFRATAIIVSVYFAFRAYRSFTRPGSQPKSHAKHSHCAFCGKVLSWSRKTMGCAHCGEMCAMRERSELGGGRMELQRSVVDGGFDALQPAKG